MVNLKCSNEKVSVCPHKFNIDVCRGCKYREHLVITKDISLYELSTFSVGKSIFKSEIDKIKFLTDFVGILSMHYGGIEIVEYSYKEDINSDNYCTFKVITKELM